MGNKRRHCVGRSRKKRYRILRKELLTTRDDLAATVGNVSSSESLEENVSSEIPTAAVLVQDDGIEFLLDDSDLGGIEMLPQTPTKNKSPAKEDYPEFSSPPVKLLRQSSLKSYSKSGSADNATCDEMELLPVNKKNFFLIIFFENHNKTPRN